MDTVAAHKSETLFCFANFVTLGPDSAFKSRTIRGVVKRSVFECVDVLIDIFLLNVDPFIGVQYLYWYISPFYT